MLLILLTQHLTVNDQKTLCPYCFTDLKGKEWSSLFHEINHYKQTVCGCGKEIIIKVDFESSGHDSWDGTLSWKKQILPKSVSDATITVLENIVQRSCKKAESGK